MKIKITRLRDDVSLPAYATAGSVAFDLAPCDQFVIPARGSLAVPTGLIVATPPGHVLLIAPRSSLFRKKGLMLANSVGVIDQDYQGPTDQIHLLLWNPGDADVTVEKGERLAQGFFTPVVKAEWQEAAADGPVRGGIGSTGGYQN